MTDPMPQFPEHPHGITLRPMRAADLESAWQLSMAQQWPHRLVDWEDALSLGEGIVAESDGHVVGTAMRWQWGHTHATVGLVIVSSRVRGRRIGSMLMDKVLAGLERREVWLHATEEGRGLYERLGFVRTGEIRQHQGVACQPPLIALDRHWRLRPLDGSDEAALSALDARARGWDRQPLLRRWLDTAAHTIALDHDGRLDGYAMLRRFGRSLVIGPVISSDDVGARALMAHLMGMAAGQFVRIDLHFDASLDAHQSGLIRWAEAQHLQRAGSMTTMVRHPPSLQASATEADDRPPRPYLFALATQALG